MKNWRTFPFLMIWGGLQINGGPAVALQIPIRGDWLRSADHIATPAYVWQNDPEILRRFNASEVTNFCVPGALGTAFVNQAIYETPPSTQLKLPGITGEAGKNQVVDSNAILLDLVRRCNTDLKNGTNIDDSVRCAAEFYRDSGYTGAKVRVIRKWPLSLEIAGAEHEDRIPTLADLEIALKQGYQVVASIAMIRFDSERTEWVKVTSHSMNLMGYQPMKGAEAARIFVTNPTREYLVDGIHPLVDEIKVTPLAPPVATALPSLYAPILLEGRLINRPNAITVLAGLMLLRTH